MALTIWMNTSKAPIPTNAASFNPRLYIQSPSNGRVVASPDQPYYTMGQVITLTAIPDTGQNFLGWGGAATGTKTSIALVMSTNQTVSPEWRLLKGILRWFLRLLAIAFHDHFVARFGKQAKVFGSPFYGAQIGRAHV